MKHPDIPVLDTRGLRNFGLTTGSTIAVLFGAVLPWVFGLDYPRWPWILGAVLGGWGLVHSRSLRPIYYGWMRFGLLLHKVTTPLVLGIVYFLIISPMSVAMRVFGRDALARRLDKTATSYRVSSDENPANNVEKPY